MSSDPKPCTCSIEKGPRKKQKTHVNIILLTASGKPLARILVGVGRVDLKKGSGGLKIKVHMTILERSQTSTFLACSEALRIGNLQMKGLKS